MSILIPQLKNVQESYQINEFSRQELALAMNLNPKSGGFAQKVADSQYYGLITKNPRGKYSLTPLANSLFNSTDKLQRTQILTHVFDNVNLWLYIKRKYSGNVDQLNFWKDLIEIAGLDEQIAKQRSDEIITAYLKDLDFVNNPNIVIPQQYKQNISPEIILKGPHKQYSIVETDQEKIQKINQKSRLKWTFSLTSEVGSIQLEIYDLNTYNMAFALLQTIKNQIENTIGESSNDTNSKGGSKM